MELSPLQLEGYYVKSLEFSLRPSVEEASTFSAALGLQYLPSEIQEIDPLTINFNGGGGPNSEDISRWRFHLQLKSDIPTESNYPYDFSLEIVGFFKVFFDEPLGKDEIVLRVNATSLLYSTAREVVASATSRGPYPGVMLPAVSFANSPLVDRAKELEKKTATKTKRQVSTASAKKVTKKKASTRQQPPKIKEGVKNARRSKKEKS
ncbi:MAG: protein-export chaperone SecB [Actinomycetota bacterium]|nr:protein-export chaperone SecB [Actinomycetota bacterium]MCL6093804.1 protein-export chaperone SecB [Actinomycetota bacterium]MDA8166228.1 protein-export chaperone SecB [Actinomycetota bacterium]